MSDNYSIHLNDMCCVCNLNEYPFSTCHECFENAGARYSGITFSETLLFPLPFLWASQYPGASVSSASIIEEQEERGKQY